MSEEPSEVIAGSEIARLREDSKLLYWLLSNNEVILADYVSDPGECVYRYTDSREEVAAMYKAHGFK